MPLFARKKTENENPVIALSSAQAGLAVASELVEKLEGKLAGLRIWAEPVDPKDLDPRDSHENKMVELGNQVKKHARRVDELRREKEVLVSRLVAQQNRLLESALARFDAVVKMKEDYVRDCELHQAFLKGLPDEIKSFEGKLAKARQQKEKYEAVVKAAREAMGESEQEIREQIEAEVLQ